MGDLAQKNGQSEGVKSFGKMLSTDHAAANQKALDAAKGMGMNPPSGPNAKKAEGIGMALPFRSGWRIRTNCQASVLWRNESLTTHADSTHRQHRKHSKKDRFPIRDVGSIYSSLGTCPDKSTAPHLRAIFLRGAPQYCRARRRSPAGQPLLHRAGWPFDRSKSQFWDTSELFIRRVTDIADGLQSWRPQPGA
jgi:hypothetical protein